MPQAQSSLVLLPPGIILELWLWEREQINRAGSSKTSPCEINGPGELLHCRAFSRGQLWVGKPKGCAHRHEGGGAQLCLERSAALSGEECSFVLRPSILTGSLGRLFWFVVKGVRVGRVLLGRGDGTKQLWMVNSFSPRIS